MANNEELNKSITRPKDGEKGMPPKEAKIIRYDSNGESDLARKKPFDDSEAAAVHVDNGFQSTFKVKCRGGFGKLFDPKDQAINKKSRVTAGSMFEFRKVNKSCFDKYVKYLQTGHESIFKEAEREKP